MKRDWIQMKRGSAALAVLAVLEEEALHGYEIAKRIEARSRGHLCFDVASLYPLLYQLEGRRWVTGHWEQAPSGRRRRRYRLTEQGRKALAPLRKDWRSFFRALDLVAGVRGA
ncbi:MAG TPA: helix-turn-helix transcriptional regulator [Patescibacteria group bacterium]|nr:helix-turn-helix transcriptional regulator [Patescibacteria group bacterium]